MNVLLHTQDPWEIRYGGLECDTHFTIASKIDDKIICEYAVPCPRHWREVQANARLIIAAPKLVNALDQALRQWAMYASLDGETDLETDNTPEGIEYRKCRDVIPATKS